MLCLFVFLILHQGMFYLELTHVQCFIFAFKILLLSDIVWIERCQFGVYL